MSEEESESEKIEITDLPSNLIAIIYQFLPEKDIFAASWTCEKMLEARQKDFLMEELAKRSIMFLPADESRGESWKDIYTFIKQYNAAEGSGKPSKYNAVPYRGHPQPISAICALENGYNFDTTIVSGDDEGHFFTWNLEEDEDDPDDKIMVKDQIMKADSSIKGIYKFNGDKNLIMWTSQNIFYIYNVNLYQSPKFDKNSKRFELKAKFDIDKDDKIGQIYYDEVTNKLFLSPDLRKEYNNTIAYSYNLKKLTLEVYNFGYDNIQSDFVRKDESVKEDSRPQRVVELEDLEMFLNDTLPITDQAPFIDKNHVNNFVVCGNKLIFYINNEPVKKQLIRKYSCKKLLPNVFFIDHESKTSKELHVELDFIINIIRLSEDIVAFIGLNENNLLTMKIYSANNIILLGEKVIYTVPLTNSNHFDLLHSSLPEKPEIYYLIDHRKLYKMNIVNSKQINIQKISDSLKEIKNINWIESDRHRIVMGSDDLYIAIFDIRTGEFWYNFLGGSLTVFPKSFVKHPNYKGIHIIQISRNSIICAIGNLIREYKFVFKKNK